jgi:hypothetical protein
MAESRYGKYIVSESKTDRFDAEFNARYAQWATRILWMDDRVADGAFQVNRSWYLRPSTTIKQGLTRLTYIVINILKSRYRRICNKRSMHGPSFSAIARGQRSDI